MNTIFLIKWLILLSHIFAYKTEENDELTLTRNVYHNNDVPCILDQQFEFVILVDKSCNLNNKECVTQQQFIANYISALKRNRVDDPENIPSVAYFEFGNKKDDVSFTVNLNDDRYQNNIPRFYNEIKSRKCGLNNEGEESNTDLDEGLYEALYELLDKGNPINIQNIIIFSNCQQHNVNAICGLIRKHLNDNNISVYIINIEGGDGLNQIENPQYYLSCLTNQDLDRIFVTRSKYLEDQQEIDFIIYEGIKQICSNPTYNPTVHPTVNPTLHPTLRPTSNPTLNPTDYPFNFPTTNPTSNPTINPTSGPTDNPTPSPTDYPTSEPTPSPTKYPTIEPTFHPTLKPTDNPSTMRGICSQGLIGSRKAQLMDVVVMIDNSCGLQSDPCNAFLHGVGQIVSTLIDNSLDTRVMLVQFGANPSNFQIIIPFDSNLQINSVKYIQTIHEKAECRDGGDGNTDLNYALKQVIEYTLTNNRINKIIIISACADNKNHKEICNEGTAALNDIATDVYIVNLMKASSASNVLNHRNAKTNLLCLADNNNDRVCAGTNRRGVETEEFDEIIQDCLLPAICDISTQEPTEEPTSFPSLQPSKDPTIEPTTSPMACLLKNEYEFVILADNSCRLSDNDCEIQLEMIGELVLLIKNNNMENNPSVAYIEYDTTGSRVVVGLNDKLQENTEGLIEYIGKHGDCTGGTTDRGQTDMVSGLEKSIDELLNNGHSNTAIQKIITINNCKNTESNHKLCNEIVSNANNNDINIYAINIAAGTSRNIIRNPSEYKQCLTNGDKNRIFSADNQDRTVDEGKCLEAINQCIERICDDPIKSVTNSPFPAPKPTKYGSNFGYYRRRKLIWKEDH